MFKTLTRNKTIPISAIDARVKERLEGVARLVDDQGATQGYFFDLEAWEDLLEDLESSSPAFLEEMEESINSGRVAGKQIKKELVI